MSISAHNLSIINLAVQMALLLIVLTAVYLARRKNNFKAHCMILRIAIPLQIVMVAAIMLPLMLGYIEHFRSSLIFNLELFTHHTLGLMVIALWIYVNLVVSGKIKAWGRLFITMRIAFLAWMLALALGLHLFIMIMIQ
jgi:hypothetical protein